jgi:hypothetical protein
VGEGVGDGVGVACACVGTIVVSDCGLLELEELQYYILWKGKQHVYQKRETMPALFIGKVMPFLQEQVYLRDAPRNTTFFRHFLVHLSDILADESWGLTKKRSGEGKRVPYDATPHYARELFR